MADVLLTFYCANIDAPVIAEALRENTGRPVHVREEAVYGRDFSDASTAERVTGQLDRAAIDVQVAEDAVAALVDEVGALKRVSPVRWHATAVLSSGRLP